MPTSRRTSRIAASSSLSSTPSTSMVPASCTSRRLMQRMSVDFPEPEGPQMTTRSPSATSRSTSLSASKLPKRLVTPCMWIATSATVEPRAPFEIGAVARQAEDEDEIDECHEDVDLDVIGSPLPPADGGRPRGGDLEDSDDRDDGGFLEGDDHLVDRRGQGVSERLRQDDVEDGRAVAHPQRLGGFFLAGRDRLDAGADDLGLIGGIEEREGEDHPAELAALRPVRHHERHDDRGGEENGQERQRAHRVDEDRRQPADDRQPRAARQRETHGHGHAQHHHRGEDEHGERQPAPLLRVTTCRPNTPPYISRTNVPNPVSQTVARRLRPQSAGTQDRTIVATIARQARVERQCSSNG